MESRIALAAWNLGSGFCGILHSRIRRDVRPGVTAEARRLATEETAALGKEPKRVPFEPTLVMRSSA